jgi:hypothetical protein
LESEDVVEARVGLAEHSDTLPQLAKLSIHYQKKLNFERGDKLETPSGSVLSRNSKQQSVPKLWKRQKIRKELKLLTTNLGVFCHSIRSSDSVYVYLTVPQH